jgi:hypothetical protein
MEAEISAGMGFGIVSNFRKPGAGDHDAGGIDQAGFKRLDGGSVYGMSYPDVVGVNNEESGVGGLAKFFGE